MEKMRDLFRTVTAGIPGFRHRFTKPVDLLTFFKTFQRVLESNNKALEIITEMGEKLSGSYIFDINYLKKSYSELAGNIRNSIREFNALTEAKYPLEQAFARIHALIDNMIHDKEITGVDPVIFYKDLQWDRARDVGGKNYHLAELGNNLGLPVPDGFILTGQAFDEFLRHNGLDGKIEGLKSGSADEEEIQEIRNAILDGRLPEDLDTALDKALTTLRERHDESVKLAVRSSAQEEDDFFTFAGQFETILNVPLRKDEVFQAYKTVVASIFSPGALVYQKRLGYVPGSLRMAVGCQLLVDTLVSGIIYTADPVHGDTDVIIMNAAWGFGPSVVEGTTDPDVYFVRKGNPPVLDSIKTGKKETMTVLDQDGGIRNQETPREMRSRMCLELDTILRLARYAMSIETYFKGPQDIEWSLGVDGSLSLLQARPLQVRDTSEEGIAIPAGERDDTGEHAVLLQDKGIVVRQGIAAGKAFVVRNMDELENFPKGAILVARNDSPHFIRVMPYVAAIITDIGSIASHMASVCREFKIPTLVNTRNATERISHGQEITIDCGEDRSSTVYDGLVKSVLARQRQNDMGMEELYEFRRKKYILRYIAPLNLINPLEDEFLPEKCRTLHDILRFIHEKSVQRIIDLSHHSVGRANRKKLSLSIPADIQLIDLGGGVLADCGMHPGLEQVTSLPLKALLEGMTMPGLWRTAAVSLQGGDFMGSMLRMPDLTIEGPSFAENNIAVASRQYVNLSLRFGYHFNLVDSFCSERAANNHVYFRFVGGATNIIKRSRRIRLIEKILREFGFVSKIQGDFIVARVSHIEQDEVIRILQMAGRLIAFTRQLDANMRTEEQIDTYVAKFFEHEPAR